jgi:hypothetical protein
VEKYQFVLKLMAMGSGTVIALTGMIIWAVRNKRAPQAIPDRALAQLSAQLDSMQQQMDAMHVEVERVAEGQRFTTKLLSERSSTERIGG